jgi:nitrogenase molybdenum-iron protein NifN
MTADPVTRYAVTRNACKLCAPLGACLVFRGVSGAVPLLHGSQGCATYIRRYTISHFREPMDVASSSFTEEAAIFGGQAHLEAALRNVIHQYRPQLVGVATTCLSETIGDDVAGFLQQFRDAHAQQELPPIVHVSTPSYEGSHEEGFRATVRAIVEQLADSESADDSSGPTRINLLPGMISPADIRQLREILEDFGVSATVLPDYADTLDGPAWDGYQRIPQGGTPLESIRRMANANLTIEFGPSGEPATMASDWLADQFEVPCHTQDLPIGILLSDKFFQAVEAVSGALVPPKYLEQRGRLVDAYIDGHKVVSGKRAIVYGEQDLVVALTQFLCEIGVQPVLCASGGRSGKLEHRLKGMFSAGEMPSVREGADFAEIEELSEAAEPDLLIGNSKGYKLARKLGIPLVRIGFPIHDRFGAARIMCLGYRGTQQLFDRIVNAILQYKQESSAIGFSYL